MSELMELYQEVILDHNKNPRNFRILEQPDRTSEGMNPLCGDHIHLYLILEDEHAVRLLCQGRGIGQGEAVPG